MKALHTNILEANREGGKDDSIRENGQDAAVVYSKCSRSLQSAGKVQQTTPAWRRDAAAQTEPWRRISQPTVAGGPAAQLPKLPGAPERTRQKGHKKKMRRTLAPVRL